MDEVIEKLIALSDIDAMLKDAESDEYKSLGFQTNKECIEKLKKMREEIASSIPRQILKRYEKLKKKYGRGIAPVVNSVCTNCFIQFPTEVASKTDKNKKIEYCPNCGIIIYWT